ncbi:MAG TPA: cytochrome c [Candidatus Angelobacter sp.]|nr:cytochrome c [Candidatus Angelobacter sp.]
MKRLLISASVFFVLVLSGCKPGKPGNVETSVMDNIKRNVTIGGKDTKNPIAYTSEAAKEGAEHFQHHCQICHGLDGQNTGVPFADKMSPPVADLSTKDIQEYTDGQLKWIIENGVGPSGMPGWKGILDDDEMWKMVHFIRHLPPKGSLGTPALFKEEEEEHQASEHSHRHENQGQENKGHEHKH